MSSDAPILLCAGHGDFCAHCGRDLCRASTEEYAKGCPARMPRPDSPYSPVYGWNPPLEVPMSIFQAKFRVLSKHEHTVQTEVSSGRWGPVPRVLVGLAPVSAKTGPDGEGSEENRMFWEATPSGEMELLVRPDQAEDYPLQRAFLVTFYPDPTGAWQLGPAVLFAEGGVEIALHPKGSIRGKLKMNVHQPRTCQILLDHVHRTVEAALGAKVRGEAPPPGLTSWTVEITPKDG